jgi:hypothetical protein
MPRSPLHLPRSFVLASLPLLAVCLAIALPAPLAAAKPVPANAKLPTKPQDPAYLPPLPDTPATPVAPAGTPRPGQSKPGAPEPTRLQQSPFARAVIANFSRWDTNADSLLSAEEVEQQVLNPENTGSVAAAVAALHGRFWRAEGEARKPLPRAFFSELAKPKAPPNRASKPAGIAVLPASTPSATAPATTPAATPPGRAPGTDDDQDSEKDLEMRYSRAVQQIRTAPRSLYNGGTPDLPDCRQGAIGSCFVIAPVGAFVHRNPTDVTKLIDALGGEKLGWYRIQFASGDAVEIPPFTEAELGLAGASMRGGLWVRVLEKAFGTRKLKPEDREDQVARDEIGKGGSGASTIRILTGNQTVNIRLLGDWTKPLTPKDETPQAKAEADKARADLDKALSQLRTQLPEALAAKRLIVTGTPATNVPTSISPRHAYAVFGFDAQADTITLWNPHSSNFTPKGPEGLANGYARKDGLLTLPLTDYARIFRGISIETDKPLTAPVK